MDGKFTHRHVRMDWRFEEDGEFEAGKQWVCEVSLGDISVARRFSGRLTTDEALPEANAIAPESFKSVEAWLSQSGQA
jgi:hypothetical protein